MADAVVIPQVQPVQPALRFLRIIPGVLLLAAIGYAGKLLEQNVGKYAKAHHWVFPNIEYVLWAILLGLLISNTVGVPEIFRTRRRDLRVLAESGHRPARLTILARRHSEAGWR